MMHELLPHYDLFGMIFAISISATIVYIIEYVLHNRGNVKWCWSVPTKIVGVFFKKPDLMFIGVTFAKRLGSFIHYRLTRHFRRHLGQSKCITLKEKCKKMPMPFNEVLFWVLYGICCVINVVWAYSLIKLGLKNLQAEMKRLHNKENVKNVWERVFALFKNPHQRFANLFS